MQECNSDDAIITVQQCSPFTFTGWLTKTNRITKASPSWLSLTHPVENIISIRTNRTEQRLTHKQSIGEIELAPFLYDLNTCH